MYIKKYFSCLPLLWITTGLTAQKISFDFPPVTASIFAEGSISTAQRERDFALSPDKTELFYTLQSPQGLFQTILYRKKDNKGNWTEPRVADFAGQYSDLEPAFSMDGKRLFFSSNRPLNGTQIKDFDIWVVEKKNGHWGSPRNIGSPVNTAVDEYYPSVVGNGNLYFTAAHENTTGKEDIFVASWKNDHYDQPIPLDTAINSAGFDFNAFVSPDESFIIFSSYGRNDDQGRGDLYMSIREDGAWKPAKNLYPLNSDKLDYCPFVSFDKKILFFTSERNALVTSYAKPTSYTELTRLFSSALNGNSNIYWVDFAALRKTIFP